MSLYDILGLSRSATPDEIKAAYRRKARELHPDQNPGDRQKEEQFKQVAEAYSVLSDPRRRQKYDKQTPGLPFEEARVFVMHAGQDAFDYLADHAQKAARERLKKKGPIGTKAAKAADAVLDFGREWGRGWIEDKLRRR